MCVLQGFSTVGNKVSFQRLKKMPVYGWSCRDSVKPNIAPIAVFESPIERGYLHVLERIFMVLFRTIRYPGYEALERPKVWKNMTTASGFGELYHGKC